MEKFDKILTGTCANSINTLNLYSIARHCLKIYVIDIKRFMTQGSENIKLYIGCAGYSKRFGVLHHHQLNMIDLYEALVEVIYRRIR